jgi:lysine-specific demethylase/histidyl-hydroxylase NO66
MTKLLTSAPVDAACDQMAKEYLQNTLPPVLNDEEKQCSIHGAGERWDPHQQRVRCTVEIEPDTDIKLIRRLSVRLVVEDDKVFVYHNIQNERTLHGTDVQCLEVEPQMAEGVEFLLKHYPQYIAVDDLPLDTVQERVALAVALYDRGLIMTRGPLETLSDDDTSVECSQSD